MFFGGQTVFKQLSNPKKSVDDITFYKIKQNRLNLPQGATTIRLYPMAHEYRMEWNFFNYLGFVHVEHVPCFGTLSEKGWELGIPYSRVLQLVLQSFERYQAFGKGGA